MAVVWIPALLRGLTGGKEQLTVPGSTLREVIDTLEARYPGTRARLCDGDSLRAGISVAIDSQVARFGLGETVGENSEVHFVPAVSGGADANTSGLRLDARLITRSPRMPA